MDGIPLASPLPGCLVGAPLSWERDGRDWPNRTASRFVEAGGLRWHVQEWGRGPVALLVHGTGSATHSWRALAPRLAGHFSVVAPDLPGHGFSEAAARARPLPGVARAMGDLVRALGREPVLAVGHSAGAAILCRMSLDGVIAPRTIVALNGALLPLGGPAEPVFSRLARLLTWNPLVPRLLAWRSTRPDVMKRLIRGTGSRLDSRGVELYARLLGNPHHVAATLAMMAHWDLRPLVRDLPSLPARLFLVTGERDRYIPPSEAERVRARVPDVEVVRLPGLGHLAHEERPDEVAALLCGLASAGTPVAGEGGDRHGNP